MLFVILGSQEESQNDTRIRSANERQVIGSELVRLAANGDVENCRKILENEQNFEANQVNQESTEELILTNFVSGGHTALQAAAQNGHVDVCRMLIREFNTDVEFQV
jgi:hypothetical protein